MPTADFHNKPFNEGTLTKLKIFELYTRGWLPVFLSSKKSSYKELHIFDFFSGPGTDSADVPGSPLRLIQQLLAYKELIKRRATRIHVHFYDESLEKINQLKGNINTRVISETNVSFDIRPLSFEYAFQESSSVLANQKAAKLVFIDQTGVGQVTPDVFLKLVTSPTCDFLFFLSSSTLHRFRDHPAIKQKIDRPNDYYHVHRAALEYYRSLIPEGKRYFLAPFSIKKMANIYGLIFGSAHPLGIDKFLQVAWRNDEFSGEADFDINRENIRPGQLMLPFSEMRPSKIAAFEGELEHLLRSGLISNEEEVMRVCFEHGVLRQHAKAVLIRLKNENVIDLGFGVPDIKRIDSPRTIRMKS